MYALILKSNTLVLKGNPFRDSHGRWASFNTVDPNKLYEHDMNSQMGFLNKHALRMGLPSVDHLMTEQPEKFMSLAAKWRQKHPLIH